MAELTAKSPCDGLLPVTVGALKLSEEDLGHLTTIAVFNGKDQALEAALEAAHGMKLPAPGRSTGKAGSRAIWFGRNMALLAGPQPDATLADHAALTDQSDAWAVVRLEGLGLKMSWLGCVLSICACRASCAATLRVPNCVT